MTKTLVKGSWYTVTTTTSCTITDADGRTLGTAEAGRQFSFKATTENITFSDDAAVVQAENFDLAPAKLRLLGLLGGGTTNTLPAGYLAAEFLDFNNADDNFATEFVPVGWTHFEQISMGDARNPVWNSSGWITTAAREFCFYFTNNGWSLINDETLRMNQKAAWNSNLEPLKRIYVVTPTTVSVGADTTTLKVLGGYTYDPVSTPIILGKNIYNACYGRLYCVAFYNADQKMADLAPCLLSDGRVAIVDRVTEKLYPTSTFAGIVGFTLPQARQLGKLPATGGTLTISLPSNWQEDAAVADALATAEANGWVLTYQTYEADASTASTFALRRIYVRKTQNENGQYIDADGTRWHVDWCAGMIGAEPTDHGYEPFRSVDTAVAYWELEPIEDDPEAEIF